MADRVFCLVLMVLVAAFWSESTKLPGPTGGAPLGPSFLPRVLLGLIFVLAAFLLVKSFLRSQEAVSFEGFAGFFKVHWRVPALLAMLIVYVLLMDAIGFVISSMLFLAGGFALLITTRSRGVIAAALAITVALPLSLDWLFRTALRTILP